VQKTDQVVNSKNVNIFYYHVPKTAGTSINRFFTDTISNNITHAEGKDKDLTADFLNQFNFASGHLSYTKINPLLDNRWVSMITFREPFSYAVSHLCWIRKLVEQGEEVRFHNHPKVFQEIATKMKTLDFSQSADIDKLVKWLKSIDFNYLFNTQTLYLDIGKDITKALTHLYNIDYVGVMDETPNFLKTMGVEFGFDSNQKKVPQENISTNKYGFDLNNNNTRLALLPFIDKDIIIYEEAKRIATVQKRLYEIPANTDIIGYVDSKEGKYITGWCRSVKSLRKVSLEFRIKKKVVAIAEAEDFRQGLKDKKIHPTGRCAFKVELDCKLDKVSVYVAGTDIVLHDIS
jgi:hypothetical protein